MLSAGTQPGDACRQRPRPRRRGHHRGAPHQGASGAGTQTYARVAGASRPASTTRSTTRNVRSAASSPRPKLQRPGRPCAARKPSATVQAVRDRRYRPGTVATPRHGVGRAGRRSASGLQCPPRVRCPAGPVGVGAEVEAPTQITADIGPGAVRRGAVSKGCPGGRGHGAGVVARRVVLVMVWSPVRGEPSRRVAGSPSQGNVPDTTQVGTWCPVTTGLPCRDDGRESRTAGRPGAGLVATALAGVALHVANADVEGAATTYWLGLGSRCRLRRDRR